MNRLLLYFLLVGLLLGINTDVWAIAVEDLPTSETPPINFGYSFNWDYVYNCKGSSATAVDHYWILTAAHVADDSGATLIVGGQTYTQQEVVFHSQATDPDGNATADIALIRYDKPFPGYYLLSDSVPVGSEVMVCGYGRSGEVVSSTFSAYFTENAFGNGTKRWGTNKIDKETTQLYSGPPPLGTTSNKGFEITISTTKQNAGKTDYEAGCNVFDSGGGMFYNDGGAWKLVGHMTSRLDNGFNYTGNFAVATKYYVNWIKSVIIDYDTDMDGLPDWWESNYGSGPTSMDASVDLDGDDFSNYYEWIADTDPTNGLSHFEILDWQAPTNVTFSSSAGRKYQIEFRTDLVDTNDAWQTEVDWFVGSSPETEKAVSSTTSNRFYRIRAKLP